VKTTSEGRRKGMQWTLLDQLDDLDFDDSALLSHSCKQMQGKTTILATTSNEVGLKINKKTELIKIDTISSTPIQWATTKS
jgi:hypothetical protein